MKLSRDYSYWLFSLFVVAIFAGFIFGLTGFRAIAAIALLFILPVMLLLKQADLDVEEKIFLSLFIGIGLFPLLVWIVNQALPSFRLSIPVAFALLALVPFFWSRVLGRLSKKRQ